MYCENKREKWVVGVKLIFKTSPLIPLQRGKQFVTSLGSTRK
jgi:hypothetical protein